MRAKRDYGRERYNRQVMMRKRILDRVSQTEYWLKRGANSWEWERERMAEMRQLPEWRQMRQYDHGYIQARLDSLRDRTWNEDTTRVILCDGRLYIGNEDRALDGTGRWPFAKYIGRVWKDQPDRFYTIEPELTEAFMYPAVEESLTESM